MTGTSGIPKTDHVEEHITGATPPSFTSKPGQVSSNATPSSPTFADMFFILIILGVFVSAFVWIGGVRYLTRFLPDGFRARYSRVADDDLVK